MKLEGEVNATLHVAHGLVSYVATRPDLSESEFQRFAAETVAIARNVRNVALAPDNVIRFVHPLAGNEAVVGLDYRANPVQWPSVERAIKERATVVAGPVDLVQGGQALIARTPIFVAAPEAGPQAERRFWGMAGVVVDIAGLFADAGIEPQNAGYEFAVRGADGSGADGDIIMGDGTLFQRDAITLPVILPSGSWQIAGLPVGGWKVDPFAIRLARVIGYGVSAVLAVLAFLLAISHQKARAMALHDALTGLPNRRLLEDRLLQLAALSDRTGFDFQVYFVDLNGFKPINDVYGHAVGDALLKEVGRRLKDETRKTDTVARVGGDEFVVLMPGVAAGPVAVGIADRFRNRVSEPVIIGDKPIAIQASVGWASYPSDAETVDDLMVLADKRMYRAKNNFAVQM
ncbi:sensor domain-containing diguanylate cyclase [Stappia sp. F7233]|uniref:Sensor domain-containing diguanylate cyclase n=1 Tax=Stappia albiluteola TaxID=2758565 RepID=A0A839A992_9HYPH|nr:diguanylate cyclase [Stappia albiluteola]MBA5776103.1 sensor domain-containing diguanylate cyclase [Stappia albiluteola]